jgi:hypothetical protein
MPRKKPIVPLMLRLPSDLHKRLTQQADKEGRSLNQELVRRLEESFRRESIDEVVERARSISDDSHAALKSVQTEIMALLTFAGSATKGGKGAANIEKLENLSRTPEARIKAKELEGKK